MVKKIGIALVVLVLAVVALASTRPDTFRIERTAVLSAPPEVVFDQINGFDKWQAWSPWEGLDPNLQRTYGNVVSGVGAKYAWVGNDDVGEGRMTIVESEPAKLVRVKLEFIKPFEATNDTTFTLAPVEGGTQVTWAMEGENTLPGKIMSLFFDMDAMVGKDFEKGLAALGQISETRVREQAAAAPAAGGVTAPAAAPVTAAE